MFCAGAVLLLSVGRKALSQDTFNENPGGGGSAEEEVLSAAAGLLVVRKSQVKKSVGQESLEPPPKFHSHFKLVCMQTVLCPPSSPSPN